VDKRSEKCKIHDKIQYILTKLKWSQKSEFTIKIWDLRFKIEFNPRNKDKKNFENILYSIFFLYI